MKTERQHKFLMMMRDIESSDLKYIIHHSDYDTFYRIFGLKRN